MYRFTISCFPNACSFILFNKDYRPDGTVATAEKSTLDLHILIENAVVSAKSGEPGLICFSLQNTCHCLMYLPCLFAVSGFQLLKLMFTLSVEKFSSKNFSRIMEILLVSFCRQGNVFNSW